jgi:hypothetical protein
MKKLIALVLVLGSASAAAADLSLVDNFDGTFGIKQTGTFTSPWDDSYFVAVGNNPESFPSGGTITAAAPDYFTYINDGAVENGVPIPEGWDGVWGWIGTLLSSGTRDFAGGIYIDDIQAAVGDTIKLYYLDPEWITATFVTQVTLTPEPMTMCLLGLGAAIAIRKHR